VQRLRQQDVKAERAIALAQIGVAVFVLALHGLGLRGGEAHFNGWVSGALAALVVSSAIRWRIAGIEPFPNRYLEALSVIDVGIVLCLIWELQYAYGHAAGGVLRAPAFVLLVVIVGLRALRIHPRPIVIAGAVAAAGWTLLVCVAAPPDSSGAIGRSQGAQLLASQIIPVTEIERLAGLIALVIVLAAATYSARRMLSTAAHAADYGEALDAARKHLEASSRARREAENALAALDRRDAELSAQNRLFNTALAKMSQGLCMFDQKQRLLVCNDRYVEMYGLSKELAQPGTPFRKIVESRIERGMFGGQDASAYLDERLASVREAVRHTRLHELSDGRIIAITHEPMEGGGWVATHDDVTYLRQIEAKLSHLARHDALTDLPNRTQLRERMTEILDGGALADGHLVVLLLEIDRFKELNDSFGSSIGDRLLQDVAQRLRRRLDDIDMVARIGGDEFVVLQVAKDAAEAADGLAKQVHAILGTSFDIEDRSIAITTSIGVAVAPADGHEADELLKNADLALERAKRDGPGLSSFFERELDERMRARHKLEQDMRAGLRENQFELRYQPQIELEHNRIVAFEALLRWNHPERGPVSPAEFVPLAEETGFIIPLGDWVLRQACADASRWSKDVRVAVNLSVAQFRSGNVRQSVISALATSLLSPKRLELEITESVLMDNASEVAHVLGKLQELGIGIALDDFGIGYSSLSYLTRIRFDKIKIDKHFVHELRSTPNSALAVLRSVVALSKSLGIATLAEGIESKRQLARVRAEGCSEAQGFYVGRPVAADDVAALVARQNAEPASKRTAT